MLPAEDHLNKKATKDYPKKKPTNQLKNKKTSRKMQTLRRRRKSKGKIRSSWCLNKAKYQKIKRTEQQDKAIKQRKETQKRKTRRSQ